MDIAAPRQTNHWVAVAAALAAGLLLRLWFILHGPAITGDALVYGDIARNLLNHGVYGFTQAGAAPRPTLLRLPGYPIFLAACFALFGVEHYRAVMYVQAALDLGTCALIAATVRRLFGHRAARAALWLAALCPFTANYTAVALTEILSLLCIAAAFHALVRWQTAHANRWAALLGASLASAVLLRPEQGLLAAAVLPTMAWIAWHKPTRRGLISIAIAAALLAAPLAAWTVRNWITFHVLQPLAPRNANDPGEQVPIGFQRWFRTWGVDFISTDQVYWHYDTDPILVTDLPTRAFDTPEQYRRTAALLDVYNQTTTATPDFDARFRALADERIHAAPLRYYVALPLARLANMLFRPRTELLPSPSTGGTAAPVQLSP